MAKKQPPIGFGRKEQFLEDPNGTGDGARFRLDKSAEEPTPPERPNRLPLVEPIAVDDLEMNDILEAYNLFPLVPLAKFEYQLVEVIAALEQRLRQVDPDLQPA
jgi:hypothetical protein